MTQKLDTRERLIEAAMELFVFQGYAATGLAQIARKAGALPGSLYYFFPTKEDLLAATLEKRLELLDPEVLTPIWARIDDPIERVFGLLAGYRQMLELTEFRHGCPIGNLVIEVGETHPHARALLVANFDNWLAAIEQCFVAAGERLPAHADARQLAVFVLTTMEGAVMLARSYRNFEAYDAAVVSLRDYIERLLRDAASWSAETEQRAASASPTPKSKRQTLPMKTKQVDTPEISDAVVKEKTGKTLKAWFAALDQAGGLETGRRGLVNAIYESTNKDVWWSTTLVVEYERAKGQKEKDGKPTGYSICSTKTIAAPLERVFGAFGDAQQLDQWLGPKTKLDFADGGSFSNGDGDRGTFKKIRANKDIKLAWENAELAPGTAVEVMFADKGKGKTGITLNHTRIQSRRDADRVREAWGAAFDKLKALLEKA